MNGFGQLHPRSQGIRTLGALANAAEHWTVALKVNMPAEKCLLGLYVMTFLGVLGPKRGPILLISTSCSVWEPNTYHFLHVFLNDAHAFCGSHSPKANHFFDRLVVPSWATMFFSRPLPCKVNLSYSIPWDKVRSVFAPCSRQPIPSRQWKTLQAPTLGQGYRGKPCLGSAPIRFLRLLAC